MALPEGSFVKLTRAMSTFTFFHIGGSESAYSDSGLADTPVLYSQAETVKNRAAEVPVRKNTPSGENHNIALK
ncbi:hypothetical protein JCM19237_5316 [Photobacterium aphoticum]|uniref:Uncharacterized protein n=1 Tax=Photobacterium aphoticum TaxID=754436 RepID=A0A090QJJ9_9GAMM|nr:hypothetical protein JCM19237_5316 [Photobacterium aphoticum]